MATWADVERIAASLPQTAPGKAWGRPAWTVQGKWFVVDRAPRHDALDPVTGELAEVMTDSWLVRAPKRLARGFLAGRGPQEAP